MPLGLYPQINNDGTFIKPRGKLLLDLDNPLVQPKQGLVFAWTSSEGDGFRIRDYAQGYPEIVPGASTHAQWTSGIGMPALDFTGGAKEVRFPRKAGLPTIASLTAAQTMLAVIYPTANSGQIFSMFGSASSDTQGIGIGTTGLLVLEEASSPNESSTLTVALNKRHVVGISQTGASARTYIVDGATATGSTTVTSTHGILNTSPYILGRCYVDPGNVVTADDYKGFIEMVMVWNTALTVPQLKSLCSNPYQCWTSQPSRFAFSFGAQPTAFAYPQWPVIAREILGPNDYVYQE